MRFRVLNSKLAPFAGCPNFLAISLPLSLNGSLVNFSTSYPFQAIHYYLMSSDLEYALLIRFMPLRYFTRCCSSAYRFGSECDRTKCGSAARTGLSDGFFLLVIYSSHIFVVFISPENGINPSMQLIYVYIEYSFGTYCNHRRRLDFYRCMLKTIK